MKNRTKRAYAAALVAAAGLAAMPPSAGATQEESATLASVAVGYRDLDLGAPEGIAILRGRLRAAARSVCGAPEREELRAVFARRVCVKDAIARATDQVGVDTRRIASLP